MNDTTNLACGFDFRLTLEDMPDYYVEVKGMSGESGSVLLTENEYEVAKCTKERYCLFRSVYPIPYSCILEFLGEHVPIVRDDQYVREIKGLHQLPGADRHRALPHPEVFRFPWFCFQCPVRLIRRHLCP